MLSATRGIVREDEKILSDKYKQCDVRAVATFNNFITYFMNVNKNTLKSINLSLRVLGISVCRDEQTTVSIHNAKEEHTK